ncbi:nuclear transport factor 2 family protein [Ferrovibrio sp.]|uniref:nuclear transport factor 2 family protein n=1 Tax=Ferrovibrio sp. TaxID=1917215 RepID=UPI0035AF2342
MSDSMQAQWACQQALTGFFNGLDDRRFDDMLAHFASDGVWTRQGTPLNGHADIRAVLAERSATVVTRHLISNAEMRVIGDTAEGSAVVTIYHHDDKTGALPAKLEPPRSILLFKASFARRNDHWVIIRLRSERLFA